MAAAKAERGAGAYEMPVLYEKMDGMYLALQWKDRLEHGLSKGNEGVHCLLWSLREHQSLPTRFPMPAWGRQSLSVTMPRM